MAETVVTGSSPAGAATAFTINVASDFVVTGAQPSWASSTESWLNAPGNWGTSRLGFSTGYIRDFGESFVLAEVAAMSASKLLTENTAVLSSISNAASSAQFETFSTVDVFGAASAIAIMLNETFNFAEAAGVSTGKFLAESAALLSSIFKDINATNDETLGLVETFNPTSVYIRAFVEALALVEQIEKSPGLRNSESFSTLEQIKRNAAAVISDILIGTTDIDAAKFQSLLTQYQAVGYGPFLSFMEGEHEYKSAIFKAAVTSGSVASGRLIALKLNVDVPDVFDSGGVAVAATGTTVNFNNAFYSLPEVNVSIKGGVTFAAPVVSNITLTSFKVELRDATNALVAGNVSWAAQGY